MTNGIAGIADTEYFLLVFIQKVMLNESNIPMYIHVLDECNIKLYVKISAPTHKGAADAKVAIIRPCLLACRKSNVCLDNICWSVV